MGVITVKQSSDKRLSSTAQLKVSMIERKFFAQCLRSVYLLGVGRGGPEHLRGHAGPHWETWRLICTHLTSIQFRGPVKQALCTTRDRLHAAQPANKEVRLWVFLYTDSLLQSVKRYYTELSHWTLATKDELAPSLLKYWARYSDRSCCTEFISNCPPCKSMLRPHQK